MSISHGVLLLIWRSSATDPDEYGPPRVKDKDVLRVEGAAGDSAFRNERELELSSLITETEERLGEGSRVTILWI